MKTRRFILTRNFKSPYIARNGMAHSPHQLGYKMYRKGEQINGEVIKDSNNTPLFVQPSGDNGLVIPLDAVKEVVTKDVIVSNAEGSEDKSAKGKVIAAVKNGAERSKYPDAAIIGALVGFGLYRLAVKKTWLIENQKHMLIAIGLTAGLGMYGVYRFSSTKPKTSEA